MINWYFAYGSNMNPQRMRARGVPFVEAVSGHLPNFSLCFNKRAAGKNGVAYANIGHCEDGCVEGVLYRLADAGSILVMDQFEGCPIRYSRDVLPIVLPAERTVVNAWVYFANPAYIAADLLPERRYLDHLRAGSDWHSEPYRVFLGACPAIEYSDIDQLVNDDSECNGLIRNV